MPRRTRVTPTCGWAGLRSSGAFLSRRLPCCQPSASHPRDTSYLPQAPPLRPRGRRAPNARSSLVTLRCRLRSSRWRSTLVRMLRATRVAPHHVGRSYGLLVEARRSNELSTLLLATFFSNSAAARNWPRPLSYPRFSAAPTVR